jgi:hypothetical protein
MIINASREREKPLSLTLFVSVDPTDEDVFLFMREFVC